MKFFRRLFFKMVKRYKRLELKFIPYDQADKFIRENPNKSEQEQWVLAKEEDTNHCLGWVYIERRERILE